MTFQEQVHRDAAIGAEAYEFSALAEAMKRMNSIIFVYARWSGSAIHSWQTLTTVLADLGRRPLLLVVDADEVSPRLALELIGQVPQGKGETFWVKEKVIAKLAAYGEEDVEVLKTYSELIVG